jgi:acetylornithine deacetylase/succinyl-diaminopimelate desuccinylase-like protein
MTAGDRYRDLMYSFIDSALKEIGARESCSENERKLGCRLAELWSGLGLEVKTETFHCNPKAFLGFIPFAALLDLAAVIAYWFSPLLCFLLAGGAFVVVFFELVRYRELVDPLFPLEKGENIIATLRPQGEVRRRVVVSAHQDSAYEFVLWYMLKNAAVPIMLVGFAALPITALSGLAKFIFGDGPFFDALGYLCMALYPVAGLNLFFHVYMAVPGAMDDLAGISILVGLSKALTDGTNGGLRQTEVVLLATSSEEAGLRGAKRYVEQHLHELRALPSHGIFVDSIYDERFLTVLTSEPFTKSRHDPRLIRLAKDVAAKRNQPIHETVLALGATDASAFAAAGLSSISLIEQDPTRLVPNYHTRLDVIEHVRPESLAILMQLVLDMIERIDAGELDRTA